MSRTYRRRGQTHEYRWVLRDRSDATPWWAHALLDPHSKEGRHAIARFHSDAEFTMRSGGPPLVVRLHGGRAFYFLLTAIFWLTRRSMRFRHLRIRIPAH